MHEQAWSASHRPFGTCPSYVPLEYAPVLACINGGACNWRFSLDHVFRTMPQIFFSVALSFDLLIQHSNIYGTK